MNKFLTFLLIIFTLCTTATCVASSYSDQGVAIMTGTLAWIDDPATCATVDCKIGDTIKVAVFFYQANWNAPGSNFTITFYGWPIQECSVNACNFTDPRCDNSYETSCSYAAQISSSFDWVPSCLDGGNIFVINGHLAGMDWGCGTLEIQGGAKGGEWEEFLTPPGIAFWSFGGTVDPVYATPAPEPETFPLLLTGAIGVLGVFRRNLMR